MKVILLQNVTNVGKKDEVKDVKDGFAANFLIPKKLAILAIPKELEKLRKIKELEEQRKKAEEEKLKELAKKIEGITLETTEKADENGTLYGGVDKKRIAELLSEKGFEIDEGKIKLFSHLKKIGEQEIEIEVLPQLRVKIKLNIQADV